MKMKVFWLSPTLTLAACALGGCMVAGCSGDDASPPAPVADAAPDSSEPGDSSTGDAGTDATLPPDSGPTSDAGDAGDAGDGGSSLVARGSYLVNAVAACGDCHTTLGAMGPDPTKLLAGNPGFFQVPGLGPDGGVGIVSPPNLTPDTATGLGSWTDAQIKAAFLNGIDKDGKALFPIMPYYVFHNMTSDDADAIVAYLRSIPAVSHTIPERNFDFAQPAMPIPAADIPSPVIGSLDASADAASDAASDAATDPLAASAARGKYLAGNIGVCMECHTTHVSGPIPLDVTKLFGGGDDFPAAAFNLSVPPFPPVIYSANITPDSTGIQGWAAANVVAAMKQGVDISGAPLCPPMPFGPKGAFGKLTDSDALDIANYITHLPPVVKTITPLCHNVLATAGDGGAKDATPE